MTKYFLLLLFTLPFFSFSQTVTVLDESSLQPLVGATVLDQKSKVAVLADAKGQADISSMKSSDQITISSIGYQSASFTFKELETRSFSIALTQTSYSIDAVVVSTTRFDESKEDMPQQVEQISMKDLRFMNQATSADVLQNTGLVMVQKSQLGGGSPIIRGFEASRVLIVIDGVRMNNAIYRAGHLQNIITLDNSIMDNVEIVFGPSSVVYGSDALGGVMHFTTRKPLLAGSDGKSYFSTNATVRYGTAANEKTAHVDFNIGLKKIAFLTSFTFSDFDDLRSGNIRNPFYSFGDGTNYIDFDFRNEYINTINGEDSIVINADPNRLVGSGYSQYDFMEKILFQQNENVSHTLNFQFSNSSDIPRYDRLTQYRNDELRFAEWYYGPQKRLFGSYLCSMKRATGPYDFANITLAFQDIEESRNTRKFKSSILKSQIEKVKVLTLNADFEKRLDKNELRYGVEFTYNKVSSLATDWDVDADSLIGDAITRYPNGGSSMNSFAAYATHTYEANEKLIFNEGLRFSYVSLHSDFGDTTFFPFPFTEIDQRSTALTGIVGITFKAGMGWRFAMLGSTGFRAPNVDDLAKVFESAPGTLIVPNPVIKPEYTYNGEISIAKTFDERIHFEGIAYYTLYDNKIVTGPGTFNGSDFVEYEDTLSQVLMNSNAGNAFIYGLCGIINADVTDHFSIESSGNFTYGRVVDSSETPLDHIPPFFGRTAFNLHIKKFQGEFFTLYSGWKKAEDYSDSGEDNQATAAYTYNAATDEYTLKGSPSWMTLNVRSAYQINKYIQLQVAVENILDTHYHSFASNMAAPGRNFMMTLRARI